MFSLWWGVNDRNDAIRETENKMTALILIVAVYFALVIQTTLPPLGLMGGTKYFLIPSILAYASLSCSFNTLIVVVLVGGLLHDGLTQNPLGMSVIPLFICGLTLQGMRKYFFRGRFITHMMMGVALGFAVALMQYLVESWHRSGGIRINSEILMRIYGTAMINLIVAPFFFKIMDTLCRTIGEEPGRFPDDD